jgi:hypothetical protein
MQSQNGAIPGEGFTGVSEQDSGTSPVGAIKREQIRLWRELVATVDPESQTGDDQVVQRRLV